MANLRRVGARSFVLDCSADSQTSLSTESHDRNEDAGSPCQGPMMDFDLTPIFLDSDDEVAAAEIRPVHCTTEYGWTQPSLRSLSLMLTHSDLYNRRIVRHTAK